MLNQYQDDFGGVPRQQAGVSAPEQVVTDRAVVPVRYALVIVPEFFEVPSPARPNAWVRLWQRWLLGWRWEART